MRARLHATLCIAAATGLAGVAHGACQTPAEVEAWFHKARQQEPVFPLKPPWVATLKRESWAVVTPQEVADLREIVRGKPEHPLRATLQHKERWLKYGPDETTFVLWYLDDETWRIRQDPGAKHTPDEPGNPALAYFKDVGRNGDRTWSIWNRGLDLHAGADRMVMLESVRSKLRAMFDSRLRSLTREMVSGSTAVAKTGLGWDVSFDWTNDRATTVSLTWDATSATGRVVRVATYPKQQPTHAIASVLDGWVEDELGTHATVIYGTDGSDGRHSTHTLVDLRACTAAEVRERAAPPKDGQVDPARGVVLDLRTITDRVADIEWRKSRSTDGKPGVMERQYVGPPPLPSRGYSATVAWLVAGATSCAVLAFVWIRRRAA